jgi:regulator of protease activity HflC (stomatin/prohibitin superfamily)
VDPHQKRLLAWVGGGVLGLFALWGAWLWFVERVEVPPGKVLVRIKLTGKNLPEGQVVALSDDHKGIQHEVWGEGRYFLNPFVWTYEIKDAVDVAADECLVLTRKYGKEIPLERLQRGDIFARGDVDNPAEDDERGIVEKVLRQGRHRLNPYAYDWKIEKVEQIRAQQVGVHTLKVGLAPDAVPPRWWQVRTPYVVQAGCRGVQAKPKGPGTYWINRHKETIVPVDVSTHTAEFTDISFPSKDGFRLTPHVLVRYRVLESKAPWLMVTLCDDGHLNQADATPEEQKKNQILQKVVLPLIRGTVRIEGSKREAHEFLTHDIKGKNPREELREALLTVVPPQCRVLGVDIEEISIGKLEENKDLADVATQVTERELARIELERNKQEIPKLRSQAKNEAAAALADRNKLTVEAETRLANAAIEAEGRVEKEKERLQREKLNAGLRRDAAVAEAKAIRARGEAEAAVIVAQNRADVAQLQTAVQGFPDAEAYSQYQVLRKLSPALTDIFASDDSDFARLFARYMTPAVKSAPMPQAVQDGNGR